MANIAITNTTLNKKSAMAFVKKSDGSAEQVFMETKAALVTMSENKGGSTVEAEIVSLKNVFTQGTATATGKNGLVPAPSATDVNKFLRSDGTWVTIQAGLTDTEKRLLATILRSAVYNEDQTDNINALGWDTEQEQVKYIITNSLSNVTTSNTDIEVVRNSTFTTKLTLGADYEGMDVNVQMGGYDITATSYNPDTGIITVINVTDNITITATAYNIFSITSNLTNATNSNSTASIRENESYLATLTPLNDGNFTVTVMMGGSDITSSVYNSDTGLVNIAKVTGDLVITAVAVKGRYNISLNLTNASSTNVDTDVEADASYTTVLNLAEDYEGIDVTVIMGGEDITHNVYNSMTNRITIIRVTGDIEIYASSYNVYTITNNLTNVFTSNIASTIKEGESYSTVLSSTLRDLLDIRSTTVLDATVTMGGVDITQTVFNGLSNEINITSVTGDIVVTASSARKYFVTYETLTNVTNNNLIEEVMENEPYSISLSPTGGYNTMSVRITMSGTGVVYDGIYTGSSFSYDIAKVTGDIQITAVATNTYSVTKNLTNVTTTSSVTEVLSGNSYEAVFAKGAGYNSISLNVTMGGVDITETAFDSNNNLVYIANVTGDIVITATGINIYDVRNYLNNITSNNSNNKVVAGDDYMISLDVASGYEAMDIEITMNGSSIVDTRFDGTHYEYTVQNVTGDIEIVGIAINKFSITKNLTNATTTDSISEIFENDSYEAVFSPATNYVGITVTVLMGEANVTQTAYNSSTGRVYIANVTGDVIITATGVAATQYSVEYALTGVTNISTETVVTEHDSYTIRLSTDAEYEGMTVQVHMNGIAYDIVSETVNDTSFEYTINDVIGDITVTAVAFNVFTITKNFTKVSTSNALTSIKEHEQYEALLVNSAGNPYTDVTILMGGVDVTDTYYDAINKHILIADVTGDLVITAEAYNKHAITNTLTNVTTDNSLTEIRESERYEANLEIVGDFDQLEVTVMMGRNNITKTAFDGVSSIVIETVTDDIIITAVAYSSVITDIGMVEEGTHDVIVDETKLQSGEYILRYIDANDEPVENFDKIGTFTI